MMPFRLIPCAATALALLTCGVAGAASPSSPANSCSVIIDPSGDATGSTLGPVSPPAGAPTPPNDDQLDVLSAGLASDGKFVTTVLRMKAGGLDVMSPQKSFFYFGFQVGGEELQFSARTSPLGEWSFDADNVTTRTQVEYLKGEFDAARNEIRITALAEELSPLIRRGAKFTAIRVRTVRFLQIGLGAFMTVDTAATDKPEVVRAKSCLKPVR